MLVYAAGSFLFGIAYSIVAVKLYRAVTDRKPFRAAGHDLLLGILAAAPLQAWALSGSSTFVLLAEILGSALGTFLATR